MELQKADKLSEHLLSLHWICSLRNPANLYLPNRDSTSLQSSDECRSDRVYYLLRRYINMLLTLNRVDHIHPTLQDCKADSHRFHTVVNHSLKYQKLGMQLDFQGILLLIWGATVPLIYYGFYCDRSLQITYWSLVSMHGISLLYQAYSRV